MKKQLILVSVAMTLGLAMGVFLTRSTSPGQGSQAPVASVKALAVLDETKTVVKPEVVPPFRRTAEAEKATALMTEATLTAESQDKVATFADLLAQEVTRRHQLEARLASLQTKVSQLESAVTHRGGGSPVDQGSQEEGQKEAEEDPVKVSEARFLQVGFDRVSRAELLKRADEIAMERLNLRYQARREGWFRTPEYRDAVRELRGRLQNELGEDTYDRFLYASERPNRLLVDSVMESSPAQQFGLQPGDVIYRYDGSRIFSRRDLRQATSRGIMGESVAVEVQRGGEVLEVELPRGPIGIRMDRSVVHP
ncbi:MAG: PDZ domain-containing protein [Deltaproteobacteria bacterium]|nr:PDZ domain-containing protein [Deltaproteobacteria bacterium]